MTASGRVTNANLDDLFAPEVISDPDTYFAQLRERAPVYWNEKFGLWVIVREAVGRYVGEVRSGGYPRAEHGYETDGQGS